MQSLLSLFPTLLAANHLAMSSWSSFYNAFTFAQKCEWLAWTNTVLFQTSFTAAYLLNASSDYLGSTFLAYAIYDTAFLPFYNRDPLMYVHHAVALSITILSKYFGEIENLSAAVIYLESSNILLGATWLLNRAGFGKTLLTKSIGGVALVVYVLNRGVFFPYHVLFIAPKNVMYATVAFIPMNYYWCWKLICYYAYIAFGMKLGH